MTNYKKGAKLKLDPNKPIFNVEPVIQQEAKVPHPGGRPTVVTPDVVVKLEQAFSIDATISEACFYANIARTTYYDFIERNPEFTHRFEELRNKPILKARETIVLNLGTTQTAQWYAERKRKDEFSARIENKQSGEIKQYVISEDPIEDLSATPGAETNNEPPSEV